MKKFNIAKDEIKPRHKQFFAIDESIGLHKNYSFRLAILFPVAACLLFIGLFSWQLYEKGMYNFHFTQPGITAFIEYFSFPISLLSLSIVFGVMVARFHSSKQKAKGNLITEANNSVNFFYKTHEEFDKYCRKLLVVEQPLFKNIDSVTCYGFLFKSSSTKNPALIINEETMQQIEAFYHFYFCCFMDYISSEVYRTSNVNEEFGEVHVFKDDVTYELQLKFGFEINGLFTIRYIKELDKEIESITDAFLKLIDFPGVDNFTESEERLFSIQGKLLQTIKDSAEYQAEVNTLQTPQT